MSGKPGPWRTALKVVGVIAVLLAGGVALFADGVLCGPVSSWMSPHPAGGPHYYLSFNHLCWPFSPTSPAPAGLRPGKAPHNVLEAFFDERRRVARLTSWNSDGRMFWRQTTTYQRSGRVATLTEGQIGDRWTRSEYGVRGNLVRAVLVEQPSDTTWQPAR